MGYAGLVSSKGVAVCYPAFLADSLGTAVSSPFLYVMRAVLVQIADGGGGTPRGFALLSGRSESAPPYCGVRPFRSLLPSTTLVAGHGG